MLVFQTILPLKASVTRRQCAELWIRWVSNEERLPFEASDFQTYDPVSREDWKLSKEQATLILSHYKDDEVKLFACVLREQGSETWETQSVYVREQGRVRLHIQVQCVGSMFEAQAPAPRIPALMRLFIQAGLCDADGPFETSDQPIPLTDKLLKPCAATMTGMGSHLLPLVYCSKGVFSNAPLVQALARELQGVAHVVVESKKYQAKKLRRETDARNAAKGRIGIYLPNQKEYKVFRAPSALLGAKRLQAEIIRAVYAAWLQADWIDDYSWGCFQMLREWKRAGRLVVCSGALGETEEMNRLYEEENDQLNTRCRELEEEKRQLNGEIVRLQSLLNMHPSAGGAPQGLLYRGREEDLYPGEQNDLLLDILEDAQKNCPEKTRPYTVIKSIRAANARNGYRDTIEAALNEAFHDNGGVNTERQIRLLKSVGFDFKAAGKHNKITFAGDRRYIFPVASTPSDVRSGVNVIGEITRKLFYK